MLPGAAFMIRASQQPLKTESFQKNKPSGQDRMFHIRLVPLLTAAGLLVAPKAGVSQRTETNKSFWVKQGGFLMWRVLKSGNTQKEREGSVGNGVTLEHRRPGFAW